MLVLLMRLHNRTFDEEYVILVVVRFGKYQKWSCGINAQIYSALLLGK